MQGKIVVIVLDSITRKTLSTSGAGTEPRKVREDEL